MTRRTCFYTTGISCICYLLPVTQIVPAHGYLANHGVNHRTKLGFSNRQRNAIRSSSNNQDVNASWPNLLATSNETAAAVVDAVATAKSTTILPTLRDLLQKLDLNNTVMTTAVTAAISDLFDEKQQTILDQLETVQQEYDNFRALSTTSSSSSDITNGTDDELIATLQSELQATTEKLLAAESELDALKRKVGNDVAESVSEIWDDDDDNAAFAAQQAAARVESRLQGKVQDLQIALDLARREKRDIEIKAAQVATSSTTYAGTLNKLRNEIERLQLAVRSSSNLTVDLEREVQTYRNERNSMRRLIGRCFALFGQRVRTVVRRKPRESTRNEEEAPASTSQAEAV